MPEDREDSPFRTVVKGRGAAWNPGSRFEELHFEPDPNEIEEEDLQDRPTRFLRDTSKSVISRNNSPDIPFDVSLNPYRGCEHGCGYCLSGDTLVLMADGSQTPLESLTVGDQIFGTAENGGQRRLVETTVLDHWSTFREAHRVVLANGRELVASAEHRFLAESGWKYVRKIGDDPGAVISPNHQLLGLSKCGTAPHASGRAIKNNADLRVVKIEDLGIEIPMFDITTGTGDFIANGVVSHNCYARPSHEYLGFSPGLDFERMIMVKEDAPELLEKELRKKSWEPKTMLLSGITDPYQPIERKLQLTRRCLEVVRDFRQPVSVITKNHLVTRDIDILAELATFDAAHVTLSITTLNEELRRKMEPRTATGQRRIEAVKQLAAAGIPVSVNIAPVIPGLNDQEIPAILEAVKEAGASSAHFILVRLPGAVEPVFCEWLELNYPERKEKVLNRIREMRGGKLNEAAFGKRMRGEGAYYQSIRTLFHVHRRRLGLSERSFTLSGESFRVPGTTTQPRLF